MKRGSLVHFFAGCLTGMLLLGAFLAISNRGDHDVSTDVAEGQFDVGATATNTPDIIDSPIGTNQSELPYGIAGRVVDRNNSGIAAAQVTVISVEWEEWRDVVTDMDGHFEVSGLRLGLYSVEASAQGFIGSARSGVTPGGQPVELVLEPTEDLVGQVVLDGEGLSHVTVLVGSPGLFPPLRGVTSDDGRFAVSGLQASTFVEVVALGEEHGSGFGQTYDLNTESQAVIEVLQAPPLAFEIRDDVSNEPLDGEISVAAGRFHLISVSESVQQGVAEFSGVPPSSVFVRVRIPGYLPWEGMVEHSGEPVEIQMNRGGNIVGVVVSQENEPLADVRIFANIVDSMGRRWRLGRDLSNQVNRLVSTDGTWLSPAPYDVRTDSNGSFRMSGLPEGRVTLTAEWDEETSATADTISCDGLSSTEGVEIVIDIGSAD